MTTTPVVGLVDNSQRSVGEYDQGVAPAAMTGDDTPEILAGGLGSEDIVIPSHLLAAIEGITTLGLGPTDRKASANLRSDSRDGFDIQHVALAQSRQAIFELEKRIASSQDRGVLDGRRPTIRWDAAVDIVESPRRRETRGSSSRPGWDLERGSSVSLRNHSSPFSSPAQARKPASSLEPHPPSMAALGSSKTQWANIDPFESWRSSLLAGEDDMKLSDYEIDGKRRETMDPGVPVLGWTDEARPSILRPRVESDPKEIRGSGATSLPSLQPKASVVFGQGRLSDTARRPRSRKLSRRGSLWDVYERAKVRGGELQRRRWVQLVFEYTFYLVLVAFVYLVLVGMPLWKGAIYWLYWVVKHKFVVTGTWSITLGIATIYAFAPLLVLFEGYPPMPEGFPDNIDSSKTSGVQDTALLIPCYKSENIIGPTLVAALKVFPPSHIYVIANGNSPTPLDDTEAVCEKYGVNHVWSPVGSKIIAQFVGCYVARRFKNVLLIDDDCALPPNFPIVSDRMTEMIKCIGYTIKSVGPESSRGTLCQQAQDLEYKLSGIQRDFAGKVGSATFPHGAISIWNTEFLISTFHQHPGYTVSEDWFFGHAARQLGCRITMCTSVFIETETPNALFSSSGGARGGFGEMTVFKQRFSRWNFFFVSGLWYNMDYIVRSWKLGWWEFGAKLFIFQEVYETLLYLMVPFIVPISFAVQPAFTAYLTVGVLGIYFLNSAIFNELHLRRKNERIEWKAIYLYYVWYKCILTFVNVASCYWSIYKYARYFANRHPKIVEDEKAIDVVLRLQETGPPTSSGQGRRLTVTAIGSRMRASLRDDVQGERRMTMMTIAPSLDPASMGRRMTIQLEAEAPA
jgi:hypothetical protein